MEYRYNPLGWRVFEHEFQQVGPNNPVTDRRRWVYFSPSWQELVELEDRTPETSGNPSLPSVDRTTQQFWGLRNVNDAILRRCDTNADGEWDGGDEEGGSGGGTYNQLTDSLFSVIAHVRSPACTFGGTLDNAVGRSLSPASGAEWS